MGEAAKKVPIDGTNVIFTTIDCATFGHYTIVLPWHTLTQSKGYVNLAVVDAAKDVEADDAAEGGGAIPDKDYLVDQTPPQYRRDPSPHHPFYLDLGALSSAPPSAHLRRFREVFPTDADGFLYYYATGAEYTARSHSSYS
ncbi:hypothetical protein F0562_012149 [Nyssa sinensis]|uniref:Uncharacterized protein n=1 Tax=Nyssa sinensis TaxID=561372 RepID=A0A5J4ZUE5_9ASTE|nr:hypothetical protein F0562_012149 [Nyssa sinensis]